MICKGCGEEFDPEDYDMCPYCLTPWQEETKEENQGIGVPENIPEHITAEVEEELSQPEQTELSEIEHIPSEGISSDAESINEENLENGSAGTESDTVHHKETTIDYSKLLLADIEELKVRNKNALARSNIFTFADLMVYMQENELQKINGIGTDSINNILNVYEMVVNGGYELKQEPAKPEIDDEKIDELRNIYIEDIHGLTNRSINTLVRNKIITLADLVEFLNTSDLNELFGLGKGSIDNIMDVYNKMLADQGIAGVAPNSADQTKKIFIEINDSLLNLPFTSLTEIGMSRHFVNKLSGSCKVIGDLLNTEEQKINKACTIEDSAVIRKVADILKMNVKDLFAMVLSIYASSEKGEVFIKRAQGYTLEEIGKQKGKTRERIRQIEAKLYELLYPFADAIYEYISEGRKFITKDEILDVYDNDDYDYFMVHFGELSSKYEYMDFADIFVKKAAFNMESVEEKVLALVKEIIGDGANIEKCYDEIEKALLSINVDFLDIDAVKNLLQKHGYHVYGNYVVKGRHSYGVLCSEIIREEFPNGIHTNQDNNKLEPDLQKLRQLIEIKCPGARIADMDRALTARLSDHLIECGRGMLTAKENVYFEESVFEDILEYIKASPLSRIYFSSIYNEFSGALAATSNINNRFFLHGVMSWLYPNAFDYDRDYLDKKDVDFTVTLTDRIIEFFKSKGRPIYKDELKNAFPEMTDAMLLNRMYGDKRFLQWKYNWFTMTEFIRYTNEDLAVIRKALDDLLENNFGYCSDNMLYKKIQDILPSFLEKNQIDFDLSLCYVVSYLLEGQYDFLESHIAIKNCFDELTTKCIMETILHTDKGFSYNKFKQLAKQFCWPDLTTFQLYKKYENAYIRLNMDEYIPVEDFVLDTNDIKQIEKVVEQYAQYGVVPLAGVDSFTEMPEIGYSWNHFLLQSVLEKFSNKYRVVHQANKDRRYIRSIATLKNSNLVAFDQIIAYYLKELNISHISEGDLLGILAPNGFVHMSVPVELKMSKLFAYKNGEFSVL